MSMTDVSFAGLAQAARDGNGYYGGYAADYWEKMEAQRLEWIRLAQVQKDRRGASETWHKVFEALAGYENRCCGYEDEMRDAADDVMDALFGEEWT